MFWTSGSDGRFQTYRYPAGPAVQDPSHHVTGGAVVGPVGDGHLDLLGHGRDRLDDRAQRPLEQAGTVAGRHRDRQLGRLHVVHPSPVAGRAATVRAWRALTALRRTRPGRPRRSPRRGPPRWPWSPSWSGPSWPALVWHATRLNPVDAWVMRWQERAYSHANGVAEIVSGTLPAGVTLITMVAGAAVAWLAGRRDAVVLALTAAPATLAAEVLLKGLVHRTWNGDPALLFPSGHVAVATAAAMTAVLVLRVVPVAPPRPHRRRLPGRRLRAGRRRGPPGGDGALADRCRGRRRHRAGGDPRRGDGDHGVVPVGSSPGVLRRLVEIDDAPASAAPARAGRRRPAAPAPSAPRPGSCARVRGRPRPCGGGGPDRRAAR